MNALRDPTQQLIANQRTQDVLKLSLNGEDPFVALTVST